MNGAKQKKPFEKPELHVYGSILEMTRFNCPKHGVTTDNQGSDTTSGVCDPAPIKGGKGDKKT